MVKKSWKLIKHPMNGGTESTNYLKHLLNRVKLWALAMVNGALWAFLAHGCAWICNVCSQESRPIVLNGGLGWETSKKTLCWSLSWLQIGKIGRLLLRELSNKEGHPNAQPFATLFCERWECRTKALTSQPHVLPCWKPLDSIASWSTPKSVGQMMSVVAFKHGSLTYIMYV